MHLWNRCCGGTHQVRPWLINSALLATVTLHLHLGTGAMLEYTEFLLSKTDYAVQCCWHLTCSVLWIFTVHINALYSEVRHCQLLWGSAQNSIWSWQLCCVLKVELHYDREIKLMYKFTFFTNPCISILVPFFVICEYHPTSCCSVLLLMCSINWIAFFWIDMKTDQMHAEVVVERMPVRFTSFNHKCIKPENAHHGHRHSNHTHLTNQHYEFLTCKNSCASALGLRDTNKYTETYHQRLCCAVIVFLLD